MTAPITISRIASRTDNQPTPQTFATWDAFSELFVTSRQAPCTLADCTRSKCPHKDGAAWSPATYAPGVTRAKANVLEVFALVVDIDHVVDASVLDSCQRLAPYRYVGHSSHSDRAGDRCVRLVIELSRPVAAADWPRFWSTAMHQLGLPADRSTCDASRLYYLPSRPSDAPWAPWANAGAPLDVDGVLASAPPAAPDPLPAAHHDFPPATPAIKAAALQAIMTCGPAISEVAGGNGLKGNAHTRMVWGVLVHDFALTPDEARPLMLAWNATCEPPWDEHKLFTGPARVDGQTWQGARGAKRNEFLAGEVLKSRVAAQAAAQAQNTPAAAPTSSAIVLPPPRIIVGVRASSLITEIHEKAKTPVVLTPWPKFNEATGGLEIGSVTLGVAFQGAGKSSMAVQAGAHHAEQRADYTIYYLGEMARRLLAARIIGQRTGRAWKDVLRDQVSDADMRRVLDPMRFYIVPRQQYPFEAIEATIAQARADGCTGVGMLVIDYVQLLASTNDDMRSGNAAVARMIEQFTADHELVTFALSQTSRSNSKRIREGAEDSIDLADTGAESAELERSATVQFALSYQQKDDVQVHDVIMAIGKRRFGGPTKISFQYDGKSGLWTEADKIIVPTDQAALDAEILLQADVHAAGKCIGGNTSCWKGFTQVALYKPGSSHKVGSQEKVTNAIPRLIKSGRLVREGNELRRGQP